MNNLGPECLGGSLLQPRYERHTALMLGDRNLLKPITQGRPTASEIQLTALQNYLHRDCDVFAPGLLHSELFLFPHTELRVLLQLFWDCVCLTVLKSQKKADVIQRPTPKLKKISVGCFSHFHS